MLPIKKHLLYSNLEQKAIPFNYCDTLIIIRVKAKLLYAVWRKIVGEIANNIVHQKKQLLSGSLHNRTIEVQ